MPKRVAGERKQSPQPEKASDPTACRQGGQVQLLKREKVKICSVGQTLLERVKERRRKPLCP